MRKILIIVAILSVAISCGTERIGNPLIPKTSKPSSSDVYFNIFIEGGKDEDKSSLVEIWENGNSPYYYYADATYGDGISMGFTRYTEARDISIKISPSDIHNLQYLSVGGVVYQDLKNNIQFEDEVLNITIPSDRNYISIMVRFSVKDEYLQEPLLVGNTYEIRTAKELRWVAAESQRGNTFEGYTVKLINDIDMEDKSFTGIATTEATAYKFDGTFDGNGFEVRNLNIDLPDFVWVGFIGYLDENGIVENLGITGKIRGMHAAGIVQENHGIVRKVYNKATVIGYGNYHLGASGIVSGNVGLIENVYNAGKIIAEGSASSSYLAGITKVNHGNIKNVYNIGKIETTKDAASISYVNRKNANIENTYYLKDSSVNASYPAILEENESTITDIYAKKIADFNNNAGFNFDSTVWEFKSGLENINGITSRYVLKGIGEGK